METTVAIGAMSLSNDIRERVNSELRTHFASPETQLIALSEYLAEWEEGTGRGETVRQEMIALDDLVWEARWHVAQALLLPTDLPRRESDDEGNDLTWVKNMGTPTSVMLLLRKYVRDPDEVLLSDLEDRCKGGVLGWRVYAMLLDDAILRVIGAMDRLARVLWLIVGLPPAQIRYVYLRANKIKEICANLSPELGRPLHAIASSPEAAFAFRYRNELSHNIKPGIHEGPDRPVSVGKDLTDMPAESQPIWLTADYLYALCALTFKLLHDLLDAGMAIASSVAASGNEPSVLQPVNPDLELLHES